MMAVQNEENYIFACKNGMFEPAVDVGDEVEDSQFAGCIWNVRQPWREPTRFHCNSTLLARIRGSVLRLPRASVARNDDTAAAKLNEETCR